MSDSILYEKATEEVMEEHQETLTKLNDVPPKVGTRFNVDKLRWRNFPLFLIRPIIKVGQYGEKKYGTYNFLKGLPLSDTLESLHRHLDQFMDPSQSDIDHETLQNHLAHISWNALVALYHLETRPELDDRFKGFDSENKK